MSIAKAKANAIAITHRSVVGREPQTAILYSTPLCPPLILNCERFFSTKKITRDRDEHFSELQWFWSSESELDCRYSPQTVIPYLRPPQQREASLLTEKLLKRWNIYRRQPNTIFNTSLKFCRSFYWRQCLWFLSLTFHIWPDVIFRKCLPSLSYQNIFRIEMKLNRYQDKIQNTPKSE